MAKPRHSKPSGECQLMWQIFDSLLYLDYEAGSSRI
jgi:hypothetical protein